MPIYFDASKNAYIDSENGAIIPIEVGDNLPIESGDLSLSIESDQMIRDRQLAEEIYYSENREVRGSKTSNNYSVDHEYTKSGSDGTSPLYSFRDSLPSKLFRSSNDSSNYMRDGYSLEVDGSGTSRTDLRTNDDWSIAKALQAMEFEISNEVIQQEVDNGDFDEKEYRASACKRQLLTLSTIIVIAQVILLIIMIQEGGYAPTSQNPLYGPPALTLVQYGAKEAGLILIKHQWWRLVTPIFLHAGIFHILSNIIIQLRVGGYLNCVYGTAKWIWIYFVSGIFGNILSCIFLPESVGVGSSGALLGILTSWMVWIVFRWRKIPEQCRGQRNCQLAVVTGSVAITLGFSFTDYVDWAAHFGGAIQGFLWAGVLLSSELDNQLTKILVRTVCFGLACGSYAWAIYYMLAVLEAPIVLE